jgi:hypothetical protein
LNPVAEVEKQPRHQRVSIDVYDTDEVLALVRAADSEQDGSIYLTAAFIGLRMGSCSRCAGVPPVRRGGSGRVAGAGG